MKNIKWIIGAITGYLAGYLCHQACGILGVIGLILWVIAIGIILAFFAGASPRQVDNRIKCGFGHWHMKDEKCPECMARVTGRFVTKL